MTVEDIAMPIRAQVIDPPARWNCSGYTQMALLRHMELLRDDILSHRRHNIDMHMSVQAYVDTHYKGLKELVDTTVYTEDGDVNWLLLSSLEEAEGIHVWVNPTTKRLNCRLEGEVILL